MHFGGFRGLLKQTLPHWRLGLGYVVEISKLSKRVRLRAFFLVNRVSQAPYLEEESVSLYVHLYLPVLLTSCIVTAAYVVRWMIGGGDIDPGPPNARV